MKKIIIVLTALSVLSCTSEESVVEKEDTTKQKHYELV